MINSDLFHPEDEAELCSRAMIFRDKLIEEFRVEVSTQRRETGKQARITVHWARHVDSFPLPFSTSQRGVHIGSRVCVRTQHEMSWISTAYISKLSVFIFTLTFARQPYGYEYNAAITHSTGNSWL